MQIPALRFSEHFYDHNHVHNIDETDIEDAIENRRVLVTHQFKRQGRRRRVILARNDDAYLRIVVQPVEGFWWVISAYPASDREIAQARLARVGEELP